MNIKRQTSNAIMALAFAIAATASTVSAYTAQFMIDWKNPYVIQTKGQLIMPFPSNFNGKMFKGWQDRKTKEIYPPYAVVQLTEDRMYTQEYEALNTSKWTDGSDGKPTPHKTGKGIIYALGDSITYGTKVGGNPGAWPTFVGERLGLEVKNDAQAGARLSGWRSVLTQARNHNQYVEEHVKGVTRDQMLKGIRKAGVIAFTLGTNDLLYNNKGDDVAYRMLEFVEALHYQNPQALIVIVGGKDMEAFQEGGSYAANGPEQVVLNDLCAKIFNGPKFKDYCLYIDISDLLAKHSTYENCERNPDGVHPGRDGQKAIAERVLQYVTPCANAKELPKLAPMPENDIPDPEPLAALPPRDEMWNLADAAHARTTAREKISLNGLWAIEVNASPKDLSVAPAVDTMEYFLKVPGEWPSDDKWAKNGMAVWYKNGGDAFGMKVRKLESLYYGRKVKVPNQWTGRRVILGFQWVPTAVIVYVDGKKAGEVFFPGGEVDVTSVMTPGEHDVQVFMTKQLQEQMVTAFDAPDTARSFTKKAITHAGINGDVYIAAEPKGIRIDDVQVRSHVKEGTIEFSLGFTDVPNGSAATVGAVADIYDGEKKVKSISSHPFTPKDGERFLFGGEWKDAKIWDLDCPQNVYTVRVRLVQGNMTLDELYAEEFGFRDIKLDGRNILLNGSPVHFRPRNTAYSSSGAVANDDIATAMKDGRRMGFNAIVPTSNYGFSEGDVTAFEVMARETSKAGMALVIGLPHPNRFDDPDNPHHWQFGPAYDRLTKYMVKRFQNIPGLLYWSSTHNQTGYESDQNPAIISGKPDEIPSNIINWRQRFRRLALTVNEKMRVFDPTRPVYHHESGAEGEFYTLNCYLDWAPIQERSDWFEHWQDEGIMPLIVVEWGTPHIASWSSYRGGPKSVNIWSARDWTQQCWMNEFNSSLLGERAFASTQQKRTLMDRIEFKAKGNKPCYYGGNFTEPLEDEADFSEVLSLYARRNYRDMRARGVTSFLPWDIDGRSFFKNLPEGQGKKTLREDPFKGIKNFGIVRSDYFYRVFDQYGQEPRQIAKTLMDTYTDLLGWIAGPNPKEFTRVNNSFRVGEKVEKSLVILNDSRRSQTVEYAWKAGAATGNGKVVIAPGTRTDIPVAFSATPESKEIVARFRCVATGWDTTDRFSLHLLPAKRVAKVSSPVSLYDPEGSAKSLLQSVGVKYTEVTAAPKSGMLIVGRNALSKQPALAFTAAKAGVKVVVLEQNAAVLKKLGFRYQEHGLRNLFALSPDFSSLDLTDWRGNATILPEYLPEDKMKGDWATTDWEGFKNRRVWRAGNRGIVSCVLPEKPTKGDFLPLVDGGFNLQYAPLMEYTEPGKRIIFSQFDLCGRTETSPEAQEAIAKILEYADRPVVSTQKEVLLLASKNGGNNILDELRIPYRNISDVSEAAKGDVVVILPGCGAVRDMSGAASKGVKILCINPKAEVANMVYPEAKAVDGKNNEYPEINDGLAAEPFFRGISNADIQWTYPSCLRGLARFENGKVLKAFHVGEGAIVFTSISQATFDKNEIALRANRRRAQGLVTRLVANMGGKVDSSFIGSVLAGIASVDADPDFSLETQPSIPDSKPSIYADVPLQDDDPYRYYRW